MGGFFTLSLVPLPTPPQPLRRAMRPLIGKAPIPAPAVRATRLMSSNGAIVAAVGSLHRLEGPHDRTSVAGGGIHGGMVYGESDKIGAYVKDKSVRPQDLGATIYHAQVPHA